MWRGIATSRGMTLDAVVGAVTRAPLLAGNIEPVPKTTHVLLCGRQFVLRHGAGCGGGCCDMITPASKWHRACSYNYTRVALWVALCWHCVLGHDAGCNGGCCDTSEHPCMQVKYIYLQQLCVAFWVPL
jgi:hypothetical protein